MLDNIVRGCDWSAVITVDPTSGQSNSDVTTDLTGATVAALLEEVSAPGVAVVTASAVVTSAANRTITITLTDAQTAGITSLGLYRWDVRVTTSGGLIFPVNVSAELKVLDTA